MPDDSPKSPCAMAMVASEGTAAAGEVGVSTQPAANPTVRDRRAMALVVAAAPAKGLLMRGSSGFSSDSGVEPWGRVCFR